MLDAATLRLQATWQLPGTCTAAAMSPNGCLLAYAHLPQPLGNSSTGYSVPQTLDRHTDTLPGMQAVTQTVDLGYASSNQGLARVSFSLLLPSAQMAIENLEQPRASGAALGTPEEPHAARGVDAVSSYWILASVMRLDS